MNKVEKIIFMSGLASEVDANKIYTNAKRTDNFTVNFFTGTWGQKTKLKHFFSPIISKHQFRS